MPLSALPQEEILEDLFDDIRAGKCILLVGPEIVQVENEPLISRVYERLLEKYPEDIDYYYRNESLFLFRNEASKNKIAYRLKKVYSEFESEIEYNLFKKILQLPLPLVISLNPDTYFSQAARRLGINHQFSYFQFNGKESFQFGPPTSDKPLIYNLFGSLDQDESLLLDYEDLFQFLGAIIPDGLPQELRHKLKEASSFLFLGFDFNKWYSQLLIQLLTGERKGRHKFALETKISDPQAKNFLVHQFQIQFLGKEQKILDSLFGLLDEAGLLRKTEERHQSPSISIEDVKKLVAENEFKKVFHYLNLLTLNTGLENEAFILSSRFNAWEKERIMGTQRPWSAEPEINEIRERILLLLEKMNRP